jgi:DNA replication protein DnaC
LEIDPSLALNRTNRKFKEWPKTFNNDSVLTAAMVDRLSHRAEVVIIEGPSYRQEGPQEDDFSMQ